MSFTSVEFVVDPDVLADDAVAYLQAAIPGWEPSDGNLEMWMIEALSRIAAETAAVAADVPASIFRQFGTQLVGITPVDGAEASMLTAWTAGDSLGHTIAAGTQVAYVRTGDDLVVFEVVSDVVIPPGFDTASSVEVQAVAVGVAFNDVPTGALVMVDSVSWVDSVEATSVSAGGVDAETDDEYLARLTAELRLMSPRPILPDDFAVLASRVTGVERALAINGYNPGDGTYNNERMVCVAPIDADGEPVDGAVATAVQSYLDGLREVNFVVSTTEPTYTTVNVVCTIVVDSGADPAVVTAAVEAAVDNYLSPAVFAGGDAEPPVWSTGFTTVRYLDLGVLISAVTGVAYLVSLNVNGGTSDVSLAGAAPLPMPGTVACIESTGTVVSGSFTSEITTTGTASGSAA